MDRRRIKILLLLVGVMVVLFLILVYYPLSGRDAQGLGGDMQAQEVALPTPAYASGFSLERAIYARISHRSYSDRALTMEEVGQLLWAAYGIGIDGVTGATRTVPSAGATHPLEVFLVAGQVDGLAPGVYRYITAEHRLVRIVEGDIRDQLAAAALNQHFVAVAPVNIVLAADYARTTERYGARGHRYVYMEVGHSTQNIYLQCVSLGLGAVAVGAFNDEEVKALLGIWEAPLMIIPVGDITES